MNLFTLNDDRSDDKNDESGAGDQTPPRTQLRAQLVEQLSDDRWLIACLCAAWCDVCGTYRSSFAQLAARHPDKIFLWVDIEDQADLVGDLDVENFPTLLMQRGDIVAFFGTVQPDLQIAHRLLLAQAEKNDEILQAEANSSLQHQAWQKTCNLRQRLGT